MPSFAVNTADRTIANRFFTEFNPENSGSYTFQTENGTTWKLKVDYGWCGGMCNASAFYGPRVTVDKTFVQTVRDFFLSLAGHDVKSENERSAVRKVVDAAVNEFNDPRKSEGICVFYRNAKRNHDIRARHALIKEDMVAVQEEPAATGEQVAP